MLRDAITVPVDGEILVVASVAVSGSARLRSLVEQLISPADAGDTGRALFAAVTVGTMANSWVDLPQALVSAVEANAVARRVSLPNRPFLAEETALLRMLYRMGDDRGDLSEFVTRQIGAVIEHDAKFGTELLHTLDKYFRCARSKTAAAKMLGIRRQTLYGRLERIDRLLGWMVSTYSGETPRRRKASAPQRA